MIAYGISDVGLVRTLNQDSYVIDQDHYIFVVADGIAGSLGGDVASRMACDIISSYLKNSSSMSSPEEHLSQAISVANEEIQKKALLDKNLTNMGTTVCVLWIRNEHAYLSWVGDSRIYLFQKSCLWQLSEDDSVEKQLKKMGFSQNKLNLKSMLTKSLGLAGHLSVPIFKRKLEDGDAFLLCTDGLSGAVSHEVIENTLKNEISKNTCTHLIEEAKLKGGKDNITAVVIAYEK